MIKKSNLILHPIFLLFALIMCVIYGVYYVLLFLCAVFIHEYAHYFVAKKRGVILSGFNLMPYGARLNLRQTYLSCGDDIAISLAGPVANLLTALIFCGVWWLWPVTYAYLDVFVYANFCLGLFNMLPLLPLDCSRIILAICTKHNARKKGYKFLLTLNYISFAILLCCFLISIFTDFNLTLGIIAFFVLFATFDNDNAFIYQSIFNASCLQLVKNKPVEVKTYIMSASSDVTSIYKLINPSYYTILVVQDNNGKKKIIAQSDFEKHFFSKNDSRLDK